MLTKKECLDALKGAVERSNTMNNCCAFVGECLKSDECKYNDAKLMCDDYILFKTLQDLINEHFDNKPLKFEELENCMWVWDNFYKTPAYINKEGDHFEYTCWDWSKGGVIRNDDDLKDFYRYEVKEDEHY